MHFQEKTQSTETLMEEASDFYENQNKEAVTQTPPYVTKDWNTKQAPNYGRCL